MYSLANRAIAGVIAVSLLTGAGALVGANALVGAQDPGHLVSRSQAPTDPTQAPTAVNATVRIRPQEDQPTWPRQPVAFTG